MSNIGIKWSVFLIDEWTLKQNSQLSINVATEKLNSAILVSQVRYIEPILGNDLFVDILSQININGNINLLTPEYQTLIKDYINPALIQWVLYTASLESTFQWFNGGIGNYSNENFKTLTISDIKELRQDIKNLAEYLDKLLYNYLCDNSNLYPLWLNCNDPISRKPSYLNGFIWTGNKPTLTGSINKKWNGWI